MQVFIIESIIDLVPVDSFDLKEGSAGIIEIDNNWVVCDLLHIEHKSNQWVCVDKQGQRHLADEVFQLKTFVGDIEIVITKKDWTFILANELYDNDEISTLSVKPLKFVEGVFSNECIKCFSYFDGGKSQKICPKCCLENGTAALMKQQQDLKNKFKSMSYTYIDMTQIAEWAFNKGLTEPDLPLPTMKKLIENYLNKSYGNNSN